MPRRGGVVLAFALFCAPLIAGDQPKVKATVDVVAVTPVDGVGIDAAKYPANVRRMKPDGSVTAALVRQGASVAQSDAQSNPFQPDIELRGFVVSPLLGTPQGVAVLQDGVRINEPFGDTINWDLIPENAIESIETIPGSNAAFGLNALGGVITLRTKSGFSDRGVDARVAAGSFGRNTIEAADGFSRGGNAWFVAASADDDGGWRDFSPSRLRHLFASMQHIRDSGTSDVRLTLGDTNLTGNGTVPVQLLALDRRAVFTFPDSTHNRAGVLSSAHDVLVGSTLIEINASVRRTSTATINGDAAGDASNVFDGVLNRSTLDQTGFGFASQISRTAGRNRWTAGISFDSGDAQFRFRQELAHVTPSREVIGAGIIDPDSLVSLGTTTRTPAAYATDFISVTPRVSILAAARVNDSRIRLHDHIGTALAGSHRFVSANPSIGATFAVWQQLTLFANANQASRAPTPVELTCANPADPCLLPNAFVSDPPLEQVFARTIEAGARGQRGGVQWSVDAFRTANENDIVFISSGIERGAGHFQNVGPTLREGVEANLDANVSPRIEAHVSYSWIDATFGESFTVASPNHPDAAGGEIPVRRGDRIPLIPRNTAKAELIWRATNAITFDAAFRMVSISFFRGDEGNLARPLPAYSVADAGVAWRGKHNLEFDATLRNVANARYATFGSFGDPSILGPGFDDPRFVTPGDPRTIVVGVRYRR